MATLASDNFNRANETPLASPWVKEQGGNNFNLTSNVVVGSALNADLAYRYSGVTWPNDQWTQAAISTTGPNGGYGVALRWATGAQTGFRIFIYKATGFVNTAGPHTVDVSYYIAGSFNFLDDRAVTWVDGDVLYAELQGTTMVLKQNGVQLGASISTAASGITAGAPGLTYSSTAAGGQIDDWSGGDFSVPTPNPALSGFPKGRQMRPAPFKPMGDGFRTARYRSWK